MTWIAVHPDNTMKVRVPDEDGAPMFEIGFWPPREAERFHQILGKGEANLDLVRDMVRFGVRGWADEIANIKSVCESREIDGRHHPVLSDNSLHLLYVNHLLAALGNKTLLFNVLSEESKKKSGLRSPSPTPTATPTAAPSAPPDGPATRSGSGSSSKGSSSLAAP